MVKGHVPSSKVILGQVEVRGHKVKDHLRLGCKAKNLKLVSLDKMKSDWNQAYFMDVIWEPSYVHGVKGHKSRSKVIGGQPVR